jgi:pyruvate dehydrogenase E1 component alpha subunit
MNRAADVQARPGAHARQLLEEMLRIRRFEERCAELYTEEKIRGFLHLYIGEEAIAVGVMRALSAEDAVVATYREHGHALARGVLMAEVMAEMYGKFEGCSRGRGGSMHLFDRKSRFYGGNAIVGGGLPLAVGLALAEKMQGRAAIAACFFGEGAVAEGEFHESMNLAQLWQLPVLFVCENNLYAMGTRLDLSESQTNIVAKAESYGMVAECVDGMDVCAVETAAGRLAQEVRTQHGPRFLECKTYRFHAHSMFDPQLYRSKGRGRGVERQGTDSPLDGRVARRSGLLDDAALKEIEARVAREIEDAVRFAETGSWEPTASLLRDVGAEART